MSTHLDRKALKRPDAFLERAGDLMTFLTDNVVAVVVGVAVLFVLGLGYAYYVHYTAEKTARADSALFDAEQTLTGALSKEKTPAPADWAVSAKPGLDQIGKVASDFSGTRAAFEADLSLGDVYYKHGDWANAAAWYTKAIDAATPRSSRAAAQYSLAFADENQKNYDGAIAALHQVIAGGNATYRADAMMALGRNLALKGDKAGAVAAYGKVSQDYPNSALAKQAELESAQLK